MITCQNCMTLNPPEAINCEKCQSHLLTQPALGERVKKNIILLIIWLLGVIATAYFFLTSDKTNISLLSICSSFIIVILFISLVFAYVRKFPEWELLKLRAIRHLTLDPNQAKLDFKSALEKIPQAKKFQNYLEFFSTYQKLDPENAQLALINMIRILPPYQRQELGDNIPKDLLMYGQQLENEAKLAEETGDLKTAARKHIYFSYFQESQFKRMFRQKQTTDMVEAMVEGAKIGLKQSRITSSIDELRKEALSSGFATTITVCELCRQIVSQKHDVKHAKKIYPIYLIPDEIESVHHAFTDNYPQIKK